MEKGFFKAQSDNLPAVTVFMVTDFIQHLNNDLLECSGLKQVRSCREEYGDSAIGYVQLKREGEMCIVKARVCPEHKVTMKAYHVEVIVQEKEGIIEKASCLDCPAAKGGCKHILAFLMWCHRRSEEPASTTVASYWQKPKLSEAVESRDILKCRDFPTRKSHRKIKSVKKDWLTTVVNISREKKINSVLYRTAVLDPIDATEKLGIQYIAFRFFKSESEKTFKNFLLFSQQLMEQLGYLCDEAFEKTVNQVRDPLWWKLRFGRITASRIKEAASCSTAEGCLVNSILGSQNVFTSMPMERGRKLEPQVLVTLSSKLNKKIYPCGLKLKPELPFFGASADGILEDGTALIEIKCPSSATTVTNYVKDGRIMDKVKMQMQMNMRMYNIKKCILCLASPDFESNGEVSTIDEHFDEDLISQCLADASSFYEHFIFPKIINIYSS